MPVPQFVKVQGAGTEAAANLENFLHPLTGKPIDNARVNQYLTRLTGNGRYDAADYALSKRDGQDGLLVTVRERTYAPPILQVAFAVDGSENDDVTYTLLTRLTLMDVAGYRSEWRTDIQFGNSRAATGLYRPFALTGQMVVAPHADASSTAFIFRKNVPGPTTITPSASTADVFSQFTGFDNSLGLHLDAPRLGGAVLSASDQYWRPDCISDSAHRRPIAARHAASDAPVVRYNRRNRSLPLLRQWISTTTITKPASILSGGRRHNV